MSFWFKFVDDLVADQLAVIGDRIDRHDIEGRFRIVLHDLLIAGDIAVDGAGIVHTQIQNNSGIRRSFQFSVHGLDSILGEPIEPLSLCGNEAALVIRGIGFQSFLKSKGTGISYEQEE